MKHSHSTAAKFFPGTGTSGFSIKAIVVTSGAVLMALEMIGSRIISPYFGSSVYVWGSLIAIFLAALSLGYSLGGRIADKHPSHRLLSLIIAASGVLLVLLWAVSYWVCNAIYSIVPNVRIGTLLTSTLLFFPPSVLIGMITPFAVRLATRKISDVGSTAGNLYALAAAGSIIGTLAASFVLIDYFGTSTIILLLGITLLVLAAISSITAPGSAPNTNVSEEVRAARQTDEPAKLQPVAAWRLKAIVLLCGSALMALQIIASRMISPWFGHSVYVWGSLISVFLAALSVGYHIGGRVADRNPSLRLLTAIIGTAATILLALRYAAPWICNILTGDNISLRAGTLISSMLLFFPPAMLMGMVSPLVLKLAAHDMSRVGATAGGLYALSAFGNILGTLAAAFLLIDLLGSGSALLVAAAALILAAIAGIELENSRRIFYAPVSACILLLPVSMLIIPSSYSGVLQDGFSVIHRTDSAYHHILVTEGIDQYDPLKRLRRNLQFDRYIESAIYLGECGSLIGTATTYTDIMHLPLVFTPEANTMLMIGGGGGTLPREYHAYGFDVQVAEIDPKVVEVAKQYFAFTPSETLRVAVEDGRQHLKRSQRKYDVILIDAFSGAGHIPFHLTTREFFREVNRHLTENGVVAMNVIGALDGPKGRLYRSILRTWRDTAGFGQIYVFPSRHAYYLRHEPHNIILIATKSEQLLSGPEIERRAERLVTSGRVRVRDFLLHARHHVPDEPRRTLTDAIILTDNFAPVELMGLE